MDPAAGQHSYYGLCDLLWSCHSSIWGAGKLKGQDPAADQKGKKMSVMIEEQETHVNFSRGDDRARIYTSDTTTMTKLNKLVELQDAEWKLESESRLSSGEVVGRTYSCPVLLISFRSKRIKRSLTGEQRQEIASKLRRSTSVCNLTTQQAEGRESIIDEVIDKKIPYTQGISKEGRV